MASTLNFLTGALTFYRDRRAVTAIEYVLIASLLGIAALSGALLVGKSLAPTFITVAGHI